MKFLVTGANGFIGKVLCSELALHGQFVRAALRSADSKLENCELASVGSIEGGTDWRNALRNIDVVIHLAAHVHITEDPVADSLAEFLKVNLHGTENLAQQASRAGVKRLVYVSSVKVNGESTSLAGNYCASDSRKQKMFTETSSPDPQDSYAMSKWLAEMALQRIGKETGLEVVVVRPPLTYGPGVKGNFLKLLAAIEKGMPLPLAGAMNARSLVYVGNLVDALIACATHPSAAGQIYLISDGTAVSTAALVDKMAHALGRPNRSFYVPPKLLRGVAALLGRTAQVNRLIGALVLSDASIRSDLGWMPPYSFEQGLQATVDWYIAQRTAVGYNRSSL